MALRLAPLVKRTLMFVHRWLGVALSVVFLLWFVSGIVMMYWSFPDVSSDDRLQRAPVLTAARVRVTPAEAVAAAGIDQPSPQIRLTSFDGRPVYRIGGGGRGGRGGGGGATVYADDGRIQQQVDEAMVDRAAAHWAGLPVTQAQREAVEEVDQWTVAGQFRSQRPLFKYTFSDGLQVYVNGRTADVVQYTTTSSRFWAWLGAIPHWLYFAPLRKHQQAWFSFVVWSSLIGTVSAILGLVVAVWMYSPRKRYRYAGAATSIPYSGWKRWHTIVGLFFGVITTTWAFSGLLSMGPFPIVDRLTDLTVPPPAPAGGRGGAAGRGAAGEAGGPGRGRGGGRGASVATALRGRRVDLAAYAAKSPAEAIASLPAFEVKELELSTFAGEPIYVASNGRGGTRIVPVSGEPRETFDTAAVMAVVRNAVGKDLRDLRVMQDYDAYYLDRRGERPLPVIYAEMNDSVRTRYYIDPKTARVAGTYTARGWVNRWLYHGLHSLDFPWLYKYRPLWDIVVITLMLGGTALCVTSLILTWRLLARKVTALLRAKPALPGSSEDLALETER